MTSKYADVPIEVLRQEISERREEIASRYAHAIQCRDKIAKELGSPRTFNLLSWGIPLVLTLWGIVMSAVAWVLSFQGVHTIRIVAAIAFLVGFVWLFVLKKQNKRILCAFEQQYPDEAKLLGLQLYSL